MSIVPEINLERRGGLGLIELARPQALNAITHPMVRAIATKLAEWAKDPGIGLVAIRATGDRAFSAGGDIRALYDLGRAGRYDRALQFWREEYALNALIKNYPKPYLAFIDGIVMGGGVGLSVHGSHRIVGERFQFAMPEVGIGFFPDVGATWFLPRMPGEMGTYCALTGERLRAADGLAAGLGTHFVLAPNWPELIDMLAEGAPVDETLDGFTTLPPPPGPLTLRRSAIDRLFAGHRVEDILGALDREAERGGQDAGFAGAAAALIRARSPLSLKIALAQVRRGAHWSFADCMRAEFRIVSRIIHGHDFYEGVRAVIIDKDHRPRWRPDKLVEIDDREVERHFAPLEAETMELSLP